MIFDTFIVAIFLIPAMMGILGEANWWPKPMPSLVRETERERERDRERETERLRGDEVPGFTHVDASVDVAGSQLQLN